MSEAFERPFRPAELNDAALTSFPSSSRDGPATDS